MNPIGTLILQIIEAIAKQGAQQAAPYALKITESLYEVGKVTVSVYFDLTLTSEQKQQVYDQALNVLRSLVAEAADAGQTILADLPAILLTAGAVQFKSLASHDH